MLIGQILILIVIVDHVTKYQFQKELKFNVLLHPFLNLMFDRTFTWLSNLTGKYQTSTRQSDLTWSNDFSDCDKMTCPNFEPSQYLQISCSADSNPVEGTTCSFG